ncbi:helix-turn-helix domain-containing protein [Xanthobacter agilis]|jgi:transcriptional regulator with XRE-family HTH domain|uniref:Transcriptional regulator with XRE-family HTH domain n=1 Tax=Xanthobacter agilis TaxID=47492 RepID=A0ABU0LJQ3_XANAG|nr:helix-turn-helix transcriptional regulator [Xanthobacter agilis]MDQ0507345.1 transcriptional regulator with XRE-family HTH domain [Xanthobacter agilis]
MVNGAQIRAARALLGWDQQELAQRAQVAVRTLSSFEDGSRSPRERVRAAIVEALQKEGIEFIESDRRIGVTLNAVNDDGF